jgi:hypothetical protein
LTSSINYNGSEVSLGALDGCEFLFDMLSGNEGLRRCDVPYSRQQSAGVGIL